MSGRVVLRKTSIYNFGTESVLEMSCPGCGQYNLIDTVIDLPSNCYNCGKKFSALRIELISRKLKCRVVHHKLKRNNSAYE